MNGAIGKYFKEVETFAKRQNELFAENEKLITENNENHQILDRINLEYLEGLSQAEKIGSSNMYLLLLGIYSKYTIEEQIEYFNLKILPQSSQLEQDVCLLDEFSRIRNYITQNAADRFSELLSCNAVGTSFSNKLLELDLFLRKNDYTLHVESGLKEVSRRLVKEVRNGIVLENNNVFKILETYLTSLSYIFNETRGIISKFIANFLSYLLNSLIPEWFVIYQNEIITLVGINIRLFEFYKQLDVYFQNLDSYTKKLAYFTFSSLKGYLAKYGDKQQLLSAVDAYYDALYMLFKRFEQANIKTWLVEQVSQYIEYISSQNQENIWEKYFVVHKFSLNSYKNLETLIRSQMRIYILEFHDYLRGRVLQITESNHKWLNTIEKNPLGSNLDDFRQFFAEQHDIIDNIVYELKHLKVKDPEFRKSIVTFCASEYVTFYKKALNIYLAMDVPGLSKKTVFKYYANEVEKRILEVII